MSEVGLLTDTIMKNNILAFFSLNNFVVIA